MKFPNHIILDIKTPILKTMSEYWAIQYKQTLIKNEFFLSSFTTHYNYIFSNKQTKINKLLINQSKNTICYKSNNNFLTISKENTNFYNSIFQLKHNKKIFPNNIFHNNSTVFIDKNNLYKIFVHFKFFTNKELYKTNKLWNLFDINFLRKEKIYTKLKYSRVPQYDIVSGGVAALFAGFLGFLISEKFGIELVDSGDFYFLFMYVVFIVFSLRLFLKLIENEKLSWTFLSIKWLLNYYNTIIIFFFNFIYFNFKR